MQMNNREPTNGSAQKLKLLVFEENCLYLQHTFKDEPCQYIWIDWKAGVCLLRSEG